MSGFRLNWRPLLLLLLVVGVVSAAADVSGGPANHSVAVLSVEDIEDRLQVRFTYHQSNASIPDTEESFARWSSISTPRSSPTHLARLHWPHESSVSSSPGVRQ